MAPIVELGLILLLAHQSSVACATVTIARELEGPLNRTIVLSTVTENKPLFTRRFATFLGAAPGASEASAKPESSSVGRPVPELSLFRTR
jgi:hypothetical protein